MKKIKAIKPYRDKEKKIIVNVDDIYTVSDKRAEVIVSSGYAVVLDEDNKNAEK